VATMATGIPVQGPVRCTEGTDMGSRRRGSTASTPWWRRPWLWWTVLLLVLLRVAAIVAFRSREPAVLDRIRQFNKHGLNPLMLHLAGKPHWYAAKVEHVGRRSGRHYATPVVAVPVEGGLVIPLPYGEDVDWLRNLQAAGGGAVVRHGRRHTVSTPVVLPTDQVGAQLPAFWRRSTRPYGFSSWVRLRTTDEVPVPAG
jgi:deazaflavin-dependent oxidoreductase (nitroreductase family)